LFLLYIRPIEPGDVDDKNRIGFELLGCGFEMTRPDYTAERGEWQYQRLKQPSLTLLAGYGYAPNLCSVRVKRLCRTVIQSEATAQNVQ
jgi:hypothetical protein